MKPRQIITITYRVLDENDKFIAIIKESGYNRDYIHWLADRIAKHKYGRHIRLEPIKIVKEEK